jgi:hypothetical protein
VRDGTSVRWSASLGTLSRATTATQGGRATVRYTPPNSLVPVVIGALAAEVSGNATIDLVPGPIGALAVSMSPDIVPRGGRTRVVVNALDSCAHAVADGQAVILSAERGSFEGQGPVVERETEGGRVEAELAAGDIAGPLRVSARHGTVFGEQLLSVAARPTPTATPVAKGGRAYLPFAYTKRALR